MTATSAQRQRTAYDLTPGQLDMPLLGSSLAILSVGILLVYSTGSFWAQRDYGSPMFYLLRQGVFGIFGLVLMYVLARIDYHRWLKLTPFIYATALAGLVLVATGLGHSAGGSTRWLRLGGISVQPSEFAKLALIFFLAHSLANRGEKVRTLLGGYIPAIVVAGILMVLTLAQPDFGTTAVLGAIAGVMLFVAGTRLRYLLGTLLLAAPALYWLLWGTPYRKNRLLAYLNPWDVREGAGFQIVQSYIAFGSGGFWGRGLGEGRQKLFFLPEAHTDFIFAVFGEEVGFAGVVVMIGLFMVIVWRGMAIALHARDEYGTLLATGISSMFGLQAFTNMAVVTGLLPTKGLALPLVSYGGSALVMNFMALGILQSVHANGRCAR